LLTVAVRVYWMTSPTLTSSPSPGVALLPMTTRGAASGCSVAQVAQVGGVPPLPVPPVAVTTLDTMRVALASTVAV
jgi:hypothetical protein